MSDMMAKLLIGVMIASSLGLSAWTLNAVATMPKEFVLRDDFKELRSENREDHKEILDEIRRLHE